MTQSSTDSLVQRLRGPHRQSECGNFAEVHPGFLNEAADRIATLERELEEARAERVKGPYASSPADIRATAENIAENYSFDPSILAGAICAALVSERERCAKVADDAVVDLTDDMLRELVRLAGKATPGPWDTDEPNIVYSMAGGGCVYLANTEGLDTSAQQCRADASFIEAADPPTVAALASELLKLRAAALNCASNPTR